MYHTTTVTIARMGKATQRALVVVVANAVVVVVAAVVMLVVDE